MTDKDLTIPGSSQPSQSIKQVTETSSLISESPALTFPLPMDKRTVGCLGGGQLGRMLTEAAHRLGVKVVVLDPLGRGSPAGQICDLAIEGSFSDPGAAHSAETMP